MAATDVIFRIGTMGVTKAQAEFGAIVAVLYKIGQAMVEVGKEAAKFAEQYESLTVSQRKAMMAADEATKGYIATTSIMANQAKLQAANVNITSDALAAMAKIAAATAKATGEGPEGATTRLDALTDSLIKGNDRGLKPYGISLHGLNSLSEKQADAMRQLTERSAELQLELDDLDDQVNSFTNELQTSVGMIWDWAKQNTSVGKSIMEVADSQREFNKVTAETGGANLTWMWENLGTNIGIALEYLNAGINSLFGFGEGLDRVHEKMNRSIADYRAALNAGKKAELDKEAQVMADKDAAAILAKQRELMAADPNQSGTWAAIRAEREAAKEAKAARGGGGGGRRKRPRYEAAELPPVVEIREIQESVKIIDTQMDSAEIVRLAVWDTNEGLAQQVAQIKLITGAESERIALLQQKEKLDVTELTREEKIELWTYEEEHAQRMIEYEAERAEYFRKESSFYQDLMETGRAFGREDQFRKSLMTKSWGLLTGAATTYMRALWSGSKSAGAAFREALQEMLEGYSIEYTVKALAEAAQAIMAAAKRDYSAAAQHTHAAGQCAVVAGVAAASAAALGAAGGGSSRRNASAAGASSAAYGGGGGGYSEYGGGYGQPEKDTQTIEVNISGDLAGVLNALTVEAKRQRKSGAYAGGF